MTGHDAGTDAGSGGKGIGGKTGAGGSGVGGITACLAPKYTHVSTFGAILDSWVVAANSTPGTLAPVPGVDGSPGTGTLVEIDTTDGMPATPVLGSVKLTIPFDRPNEELLFAQNMSGLNMTGETVTAYIKLNSGLNTGPVNVGQGVPHPEDHGGVQLRRRGRRSRSTPRRAGFRSASTSTTRGQRRPGVRSVRRSRDRRVVADRRYRHIHDRGAAHRYHRHRSPGGAVDDAGTPDTGTSSDAPVDTPSSTDTGTSTDTASASDAATSDGATGG